MADPTTSTPVLSYQTGMSADDSWLAKVICGVTIVNGAVDVGYTAARWLCAGRSLPSPEFTDIPAGICGVALMLFGFAGLFRVRRSCFAIGFLSGISILLNWTSVCLTIVHLMMTLDRFIVAYQLIFALQAAIAPGFVIICLQHRSVRAFFDRRQF